jgi:prepilin-type processing-associated H-X9-DG protein
MTLVELLVVIAIVAILVGLMFPVLQVARESARRSTCANNLKQLALGMTTYGEARKVLPGWRNAIQPFSSARAQSDPKQAAVSWTIPILPYVEEQAIHDWYTAPTAGQGTETAPPRAAIRTYRCPSHVLATGSAAPFSYAVNAGSGAETLDERGTPAAQYAADGMVLDAVGNLTGTPLFDSSRPPYAAGESSTKNPAADGTGQTLLLTERSGPSVPTEITWSANPRVPRERRGALPENHSILHPLPIGSGWRTEIQVINPTADTRPLPSPVPGNADLDDWPVRYPSSRHPSAVNVAFADGHVRVIRNGIDAWVYCQLLSSDSKAVSAGVADWQQRFDASGSLVPYTFTIDDLVR